MAGWPGPAGLSARSVAGLNATGLRLGTVTVTGRRAARLSKLAEATPLAAPGASGLEYGRPRPSGAGGGA